MKRILITGANSGLGKECARKLALQGGVEKIYLACRNEDKANAAKQDLENTTGKSVFETVQMDVSDLASVKQAIISITEPLDALVMNAGGLGGTEFLKKTEDGVSQIFAMNVLGHVFLAEELVAQSKLTGVAVYIGSEAARGAPKMGIEQPTLKSGSVEEFTTICDGTSFRLDTDPMPAYAHVKLIAAMWMSSMARKHPDIRFVTVTPGHTEGTNVLESLPPFKKFIFKNIGFLILPLLGMAHGLKDGCQRYLDVLNDSQYRSGVFYGSKASVLTGPLIDQSTIFETLNNQAFQDNAYEAIHTFLK